jgi:hypothetical protein
MVAMTVMVENLVMKMAAMTMKALYLEHVMGVLIAKARH